MNGDRQVEIRQTPEEVAKAAAELFAVCADRATDGTGAFHVALSGGTTPKLLYDVLVGEPFRERVDWSRVHAYFSDERFVPPDSSESNFHTAWTGLLSKVPISRNNIHPVPTVDVDPEVASARYEETIRRGVPGKALPRFDLIFLGMGPDGHTASLFPDTEALRVRDRIVASNFVPRLDTWRITFTYPLINAAETVALLVAGADKSERVGEVMNGADFPVGRVQPSSGTLIWYLDAAAASRLHT